VSASADKGFINVSTRDPRYFEYDNGAYFPALGYNLSSGDLDHVNPVRGNRSKFHVMHANGIELSRVWIGQLSMFGEAWGKWGSSNQRAHLWIANKNHTWKSVLDGVSVPPVSGTIMLGGFHPNTLYKVEWWNTYAGRVNTTQTIFSNAEGNAVRIFARPFTGGALTPNYSACGFPLYPVGTGTGTCSFTINTGVTTVNRIRFQIWNADQTVKLFEKFIPVHYQFH
jgi:hypothetical protein